MMSCTLYTNLIHNREVKEVVGPDITGLSLCYRLCVVWETVRGTDGIDSENDSRLIDSIVGPDTATF